MKFWLKVVELLFQNRDILLIVIGVAMVLIAGLHYVPFTSLKITDVTWNDILGCLGILLIVAGMKSKLKP